MYIWTIILTLIFFDLENINIKVCMCLRIAHDNFSSFALLKMDFYSHYTVRHCLVKDQRAPYNARAFCFSVPDTIIYSHCSPWPVFAAGWTAICDPREETHVSASLSLLLSLSIFFSLQMCTRDGSALWCIARRAQFWRRALNQRCTSVVYVHYTYTLTSMFLCNAAPRSAIYLRSNRLLHCNFLSCLPA